MAISRLLRSFAAGRTLALLAALAIGVGIAVVPLDAAAQQRKDSVVLGMVLEPAPGLDPTMAPAAAIGEVVHLSVLEGLTKINMDGRITPLLAESWSDRSRRQGLHLQAEEGREVPRRRAVHRSDVKFSFERAKAPGSTNKAKKAVFDNISRIDTPDPATVIVVLNQRRRQLPVPHGREHRRDPRPEERADDGDPADRHRPVQVRRPGPRARRSRW